MKIAIIADTHFGARGDQKAFLDYQKCFLMDIFFPVIFNENIKTIIHLGDLVDKRKYINFQTLSRMKSDFLNPISYNNLDLFVIAGNHDCFHKNSNSLNCLNELLEQYSFNIITEPTHWNMNFKDKVLLIPWINQENRKISEELIKNSKSKYCFGHLELRGFNMNPGSVAEFGDEPSMFSNFKKVFSGHYHTKSVKENIYYLGSCFQFTWADENDIRGFHIFDTETEELKFIENNYQMFNRIVYDNGLDLNNFNTMIENKYVKLIVNRKKSQSKFEEDIRFIEEFKPLDLKIIETRELNIDNESFSGTESTPEIIKKYIEQIELNADKKKLEQIMLKFYNEALMMEI